MMQTAAAHAHAAPRKWWRCYVETGGNNEMPLIKSKGNMYPWVTHCHTHLGGECRHRCTYCYVKAISNRYGNQRYLGPARLLESELQVSYGKGKTIFIEHCNDLFSEFIPNKFVCEILNHCCKFPENDYVFQTKNPRRYLFFRKNEFPKNRLLGCTLETTDSGLSAATSRAPTPINRYAMMCAVKSLGYRIFITIEPIMDFEPSYMVYWLKNLQPEFVNIGADSKGAGLVEPSREKVEKLLSEIQKLGIEIREKRNLSRLLKD
jgi:DNA repair photolyase